jgi:hypothetical protein
MPKQVKQQVTAGNPIIETPTISEEPNLDQTHTNTQS